MQCRRMKFRSADERPAQLEDLNSQHHRIKQNCDEITSSGLYLQCTLTFIFSSPCKIPVQLHMHMLRYVSDIPYYISERRMKKQSLQNRALNTFNPSISTLAFIAENTRHTTFTSKLLIVYIYRKQVQVPKITFKSGF